MSSDNVTKMVKVCDNSKMFGALLTDLSEAFDFLNHESIIAKLNAYGFSLTALKLVHNYLSNRKQQKKMSSSYSSLVDNSTIILKFCMYFI